MRSSVLTVILLLVLASAARAQAPPATTDSTRAAAAPSTRRASWTSDRMPLRVGDILTVVVDEQTAARERVTSIAEGNRTLDARLQALVNDESNGADITSALRNNSRDVGEANRLGDLTAVLSVRVTAIEAGGLARIQGAKRVSVDGRLQEIALQGVVRPADVTTANTVLSSRIAEAVITYKGKKIGPRTGILGRILSLLWP